MKKRGLLLLFVFLIVIKTSFSLSQDLVFSDTVHDRDVEQIEGKQFEFRVLEGFVSINIDTSGVIIEGGGCKVKNRFNICISNITFAYKNFTTYEWIYKALVKVYVMKSDLEITKNMPKTELLVDEEVDVELNLENSADVPAENVILTETYPAGFLVSDAEGCSLAFNKITFKGQVSPRQIRTCKYKLKGFKPMTYSSAVTGSYFDGLEAKNITDTKTITVLNYSLESKLSGIKENITVGEALELSLTLRNINENEDLAVTTFVLKVPNGFTIEKKPKGMEENNKVLTWSGKIEKESEINFTATLKAVKSGRQAFDMDENYKIMEFLREFNKSHIFDVSCGCPFIDYEVGNLVPGLKTDFKVSIINPGNLSFRNLKIDYNTNIPEIRDFSSAFGKIAEGSAIDLINTRIISPAENEKYYFNISIAYESPFNEFFVEKEAITIPLPIPEPEEKIEVMKMPDETEAEEKIEVETQEAEKNITQESEEKEEIDETEKEPIVLQDEGSKFPFGAVSIIAVIVAFILVFVLIRVVKGKKEEAKEEMESKPEVGQDVETPPELK